jgi:hypothetical protein
MCEPKEITGLRIKFDRDEKVKQWKGHCAKCGRGYNLYCLDSEGQEICPPCAESERKVKRTLEKAEGAEASLEEIEHPANLGGLRVKANETVTVRNNRTNEDVMRFSLPFAATIVGIHEFKPVKEHSNAAYCIICNKEVCHGHQTMWTELEKGKAWPWWERLETHLRIDPDEGWFSTFEIHKSEAREIHDYILQLEAKVKELQEYKCMYEGLCK